MGKYVILVDDEEKATIPAESVEDALLKACCMFGIDVRELPDENKDSYQYELFPREGGKDGKG